MRRIRVLPKVVVDRIAAGEVVDRPASVVKELVENALDARARRVEVDLEKGGIALVRIADDGEGIAFEDLAFALASHATSKLEDLDDLERLATFGFRGEALASIAAVARVRILSRVRGAQEGGEIEAGPGRTPAPRPAGAPEGTVVEVRDLFFEVPARRKFLRSEATELAHAVDALGRLALVEEGVAFALRHEGRSVLAIAEGADRAARLREIHGREIADALLPVAAADGRRRLEGFLGRPDLSRPDASRLAFFVNGRFVRDRLLSRAVRDAYRDFLPRGRFPVAFLFLACDPAEVDPNVHPTKVEVRFQDSNAVFGLVRRSVAQRLRTAGLAAAGEALRPVSSPPWSAPPAGFDFPDVDAPVLRKTLSPMAAAPTGSAASGTIEPSRCLQIHDAFLVRETPEGFEVVDQHALHERVTLEDLRAQFRAGAVERQRLLVPETIEVGRAEAEALDSIAPLLSRVGLDLSRLGEGAVALRAHPACLRRLDAAALVADLAGLVREGEAPRADDLLESTLESLACHGSVRAGDPLEAEEIVSLLRRGAALDHDATCAHGRPTRVRFTLAELERAFHRR